MKKKWIVIISVAVLLAGIVGYGAVRLARAMNGDVALTGEDAKAVALEHAGLTAEQVKGLRSEYDMDDGVPEYSVEFRADGWEYDYEIHAETGKILSRERDD